MRTVVFVLLMSCMQGFTADALTEKLQRGLFEEEANRNLDAAIKEYQSVVTQSDAQRKVIATAVFRLGECYRKLGKTNEANAFYERVVRDFSDQEQLKKASLTFLGRNAGAPPGSSLSEQIKRKEAEEEAQQLAWWREQVRENPDLVNKLELGPPLHQAINRGWLSVVNFLLSERADPNGRDNQKHAPLHIAVANNRREMVEALIKAGANVNAKDNVLNTPLHVAATSGYLTIAQILIDAKANINEFAQAETPLLIAVARSYRAMTELLLKRGADPDIGPRSSNEGLYKTALTISIGKSDAELVRLLLAHKADVNLKVSNDGQRGAIALSYAAAINNPEIMKLLLDAGSDPSSTNWGGATPLLVAAQSGAAASVRLLLDQGVKVDQRGQDGRTALHNAALGSAQTVKLLLERGANVNVRTEDGATPLIFAVQQGIQNARTDIIRQLLAAGADPNVKGAQGTPFAMVEPWITNPERGGLAREILDMLRAAGANPYLQRMSSIGIGYRTNALTFFYNRGTNNWNRYTLLELLAESIGSVPWADWTNAYIERVNDRTLTNIPVNLGTLFSSGNCSNDLWLEWGDRVLLPELDHPLNAISPPTPKSATALFEQCLPRTVRIVVKGVTNEVHLASHVPSRLPHMPPPTPAAFSSGPAASQEAKALVLHTFRLKPVVYDSGLLRASSDPSATRVTRGTNTWIVNLNGIALPNEGMRANDKRMLAAHDLWLRNGDVIEIPEKQ